MHSQSICFPHFNSDQRSEAANRHVADLSFMHLRDTDNWLSNTTRPIGANYRPTNKRSGANADAITSQVGGRYRHVGGIFSLEWTSWCLVLGVQNRILEIWRMPLILNFGVWRRFQDVIYAVRRLNGSPARCSMAVINRYFYMKFLCENHGQRFHMFGQWFADTAHTDSSLKG